MIYIYIYVEGDQRVAVTIKRQVNENKSEDEYNNVYRGIRGGVIFMNGITYIIPTPVYGKFSYLIS